MTKGRPLGLDELMIVNPGPRASGALFLGENGTVYQLRGVGLKDEREKLGQLFLGEDGVLYQVQGLKPSRFAEPGPTALGEEAGRNLGRFFLGEDGTLYEVLK
jgi:hypothetical protein